MAIQVICPNCQSTYLLSDALQGKNVRCKKCGEAFRIAGGSPAPAPPVVLRPAVTPEEIRGGIQASPARLRNPPPFVEPVRSEENYIAESPRHGNSTLKILLIVFGALAALAVVVCGGIVYLGYQTSKAAKEKFEEIRANVEANVPVAAVDMSIKPPGSLDEALEYLKDGNVSKRHAGTQWLARASREPGRQDEIARGLLPLLTDGNGQVRLAGVKALERWATRDSVPALLELLNDDDAAAAELRQIAIRTLGRLKDERAVAPLAQRLTHFFDRDHAARALIAMGPVSEKHVLSGLSNQDATVRKLVCSILAEVGTKASLTALKRTVRGDPDQTVAAAALVAVNVITARTAAAEKKEKESKPDTAPAKDAKPEKPADKNAGP